MNIAWCTFRPGEGSAQTSHTNRRAPSCPTRAERGAPGAPQCANLPHKTATYLLARRGRSAGRLVRRQLRPGVAQQRHEGRVPVLGARERKERVHVLREYSHASTAQPVQRTSVAALRICSLKHQQRRPGNRKTVCCHRSQATHLRLSLPWYRRFEGHLLVYAARLDGQTRVQLASQGCSRHPPPVMTAAAGAAWLPRWLGCCLPRM